VVSEGTNTSWNDIVVETVTTARGVTQKYFAFHGRFFYSTPRFLTIFLVIRANMCTTSSKGDDGLCTNYICIMHRNAALSRGT
jgi:hypothetical protein